MHFPVPGRQEMSQEGVSLLGATELQRDFFPSKKLLSRGRILLTLGQKSAYQELQLGE